jgi:hypothetical protein
MQINQPTPKYEAPISKQAIERIENARKERASCTKLTSTCGREHGMGEDERVELVVEDQLVTDGLHVVVVAAERIAVGAEEAAGGGDGRRRVEHGGGWRGKEEILQETGQRGSLRGDDESHGFLCGKVAASKGYDRWGMAWGLQFRYI